MNEYRLTSIKQTKKGRFALFFDEKFYFSIDEEILLKRHLKEDTIWSEEQIEDLKRLTDYNKAKEKAFQYLSIRQHSEKELFEKLERNYDEHTAAEIIERLKELNLLNDEEFASSYYQQMINRGKSIAEARAKLLQKGISKDIIDYVTIEFQPSEEDTILQLIQTKYRRKLMKENGKELVFAALARRGFRMSSIRNVLGKVDVEDYGE